MATLSVPIVLQSAAAPSALTVCPACQGSYSSTQPNGVLYFHRCGGYSPVEVAALFSGQSVAAFVAAQAGATLVLTAQELTYVGKPRTTAAVAILYPNSPAAAVDAVLNPPAPAPREVVQL